MSTPHGYPRPQLERRSWASLNGAWDFALDPEAAWNTPEQVAWNAAITVPFAPETPASGIGDTSFYRACWYRRSFSPPILQAGQRLILHFGAVDSSARIWINGRFVASHTGGYTPFKIDITEYLIADREQIVVVQAEDDPHDLAKPRGKQDWQLNPHAIWYPRTTGIWQTVWLEALPATWIDSLRWTPNLTSWEIALEAQLAGLRREDVRLRVRLTSGDLALADDTYSVVAGEVSRRIALADPGIDDYRNELLWSPTQPTIIQAQIELLDGHGQLIDEVHSYTALRQITIQGDRFILNGRPCYQRLVLDQGYWPESGLTAPSDDALRHDVELAKAMGFNGVRKHQKIEDPRFLYWADMLGLLVWEELPSAYRFTRAAVERQVAEWTAVIRRDYSHPCIVTWVPFNESWGVPDLPDSAAQRQYVQAMYALTKSLDQTRPVIGNDGWEHVTADVIGIHDYDADPQRIIERYHSAETSGRMFARERPGGRMLTLENHPYAGQPIMLTEFGGIAFSADIEHTWGYSRSLSVEEFGEQYLALLTAVRSLNLLSGFCYTQFSDTYQESNGLLYADRTPKLPLEEIALATRGGRPAHELQREIEWRERNMALIARRAAEHPTPDSDPGVE